MGRTAQSRVNVVVPVGMGKRGMGRIYLRGEIWWIKYYKDGVPYRESSRSRRRQDAHDLLIARLADKHRKAQHGVTVGEILDDTLEFYRVHRPKSFKDFARPFIDGKRGLREWFGNFKPDQVTTARIIAFQKDQQHEGMANATINRKLALLRISYRRASKATPPKVSSVPYFDMLPEAGPRQGFLSHEKYDELKAALPEEERLLFIAAYHTGCRYGELLKIRLDWVDLDAKSILLYQGETKNAEARTLPLYGEFLQAVRAQILYTRAQHPRCPWLFHRGGERLIDMRGAWDKARQDVGLPGLRFHDLRRSAVRNMIRAGIPERVAMAITGHKTRQIFDDYNIVSGADLEDVGPKMERLFRRAKKRQK